MLLLMKSHCHATWVRRLVNSDRAQCDGYLKGVLQGLGRRSFTFTIQPATEHRDTMQCNGLQLARRGKLEQDLIASNGP